MIVTTDIANILYRDCQPFEIDIVPNGKKLTGELKSELEKQAQELFDGVTGRYDGTTYHYSIDTIGTEEDTALKCHYVNVRILFEVLNVK